MRYAPDRGVVLVAKRKYRAYVLIHLPSEGRQYSYGEQFFWVKHNE